ncbi:MAG TPA: Asp-tRNA(Asn)/Glu-tRNA(Gln) amidotransferase subunit GatB, partial [Patescibacteria group bacterium]|nr:Asp-tRNA(Asn)/Glu-tRNA(Gln) amidotransferase subunit GatB [Patescibacteria group bacterium]
DTPPNTAICPVCTGQPGALPAVNAEAVRLGVRTGLAFGCQIPDQAHFDRKNYFYPDLPKGYQISQFDFPIAQNGSLLISVPNGIPPRDQIKIGLTRAHLEEDAAKNIHDSATEKTLVDFNRAGVPLLEIVTEPDLRSPAEAKAFLQELQAIMRTIGTSDADMEKGYMRCDANISLLEVSETDHLPLKEGLNPKVEIKNLNSFRAVERALAFEIERQKSLYAEGKIPEAATRGWDENNGKTFEQRLKETSSDYRYFPEPDLPPLALAGLRTEEAQHLPELPAAKRARLIDEWQFTADDARILVTNGWSEYAEEVMGELGIWEETKGKSAGDLLDEKKKSFAKLVGSWMINKLGALLAEQKQTIEGTGISAENFAEFIHLIHEKTVNSANAQKLLGLMVSTGTDPSHLLEEHNLGQNEDPKLIEEIVHRLIAENPDQANQVKQGKLGVLKWFVGGVMKVTEGRANPAKTEEEVKKQLGV